MQNWIYVEIRQKVFLSKQKASNPYSRAYGPVITIYITKGAPGPFNKQQRFFHNFDSFERRLPAGRYDIPICLAGRALVGLPFLP